MILGRTVDEACLDWILFDVLDDTKQFVFISRDMIVRFALPKLAFLFQNLIALVTSKTLYTMRKNFARRLASFFSLLLAS